MAIPTRKIQDIQKIHQANLIVAQTLNFLRETIKIGDSLKEIDAMGESFILQKGARPSFKGLYGFGGSVCTSVNKVIIHGWPTDYRVKEGDIIGLDVGVELNGWYGDAAITMPIGKISKENQDLIDCSRDALYYAIDIIKVGMRFKEISFELEKFIKSRGYTPLLDFCGHGIGKKPHEEPEIPNYLVGKKPNQGPKIKNGMVFCLEPMICQKDGKHILLEDKWSVVSKDGLNGSHYEHTVAIIDNKAVILSKEE